jgi:DNA polymerase III delta prime subunit
MKLAKSKPYVVLFFGPDGSGKTTLAHCLADSLRSKRMRVRVSWMRGSHTFVSFIAPVLAKFKTFQGSDNPYYDIRIPFSMTRLWQSLEFFSALPVILGRYIIQESMGVSVVGERCFLDFIVWVAMVTRDESYLNNFSSRFLNALAQKSYACVYVTADSDTILKRRTEVSAEMLNKQQRLYRKLSKKNGILTLDTTGKGTDESFRLLQQYLKF